MADDLQRFCDEMPAGNVAAIRGHYVYFTDGRVLQLEHVTENESGEMCWDEEWLEPIRGTLTWQAWQVKQHPVSEERKQELVKEWMERWQRSDVA